MTSTSTANTIASERTRIGMTQEDLADALGTNRSAISRMESNPMSIDADTIVALTTIFKCSADYLLGLSDERTTRAYL